MDGAPILRERGLGEEDIRTILSHGPLAADDRVTLRDKALYAVDELTGLITAVALVRPSKDIRDVKVRSIRKKWKDKAFAAGVNRQDVIDGCEVLRRGCLGVSYPAGLEGDAGSRRRTRARRREVSA